VHPDVIALVALQEEDTVVEALDARMRALEPRLKELERAKQVASDALARARLMLTSEDEKLREAKTRAAANRQLQERNQRQLDTITNVREAAAASTQLEHARRMASEADAEVHRIGARADEVRSRIAQAEHAFAEMEASQEIERSAIAAERRSVEEDMRHARMKRDGTAKRVAGSLLTKYDKVRKREGGCVRQLRHVASGAAPARNGAHGYDRDVRSVRRAPVRGRMMLVGAVRRR